MSNKHAGAKKEKDEESGGGAGLAATLLVAGGAAVVGFLANDLWSKWKDFQKDGQSASGGSNHQPLRKWDNEGLGESAKRRSTGPKSPKSDIPENIKCIVCIDKEKEVILIPCGHVCLCYNCAEQVQRRSNLCPICRGVIKDKQAAYIS